MIPNRKRKYYVLAVWFGENSNSNGAWGVEFGSYDRHEVVAERDSLAHQYALKHMKVVCCPSDRQTVIDATIEGLGRPQ